MRRIFDLLVGVVVFLSGVFLSAAANGIPSRPNIVFFVADDVDADVSNWRPEGKGKNITPNLDRLASEGTVFVNQQIPSSVCTPSRFSCLTGFYAHRSPVTLTDPLCREAGMTLVSWTAMLGPETPTLPRMLQAAGYRTGMAGKCHFAVFRGLQSLQSDADPDDPLVAAVLKANYDRCIAGVKEFGFDEAGSFYVYGQVNDHPVAALRQHNMDWIAQGALDFLGKAKKDSRPFYFYVATTLPHTPHEDAKSWNADPRVTPEGLLDEPCRVLPDRKTIPERMAAAGIPFDSRRAMMLAVDDALGAVMQKLEQIGRLDNTIIFFFNDNGQEGKGTVYEGGVTSPSIIWRKGGFPAGAESKALVSNIDFAPTIAEWAGIQVKPGAFDGVSLVPLLEKKVEFVREASFSEIGFTRAVRKGNWKYIAFRLPPSARVIPDIYYPVPGDPLSGQQPTFGHMAVHPNNPRNAMDLFGMRESATSRYPCYWDADQLYDLSGDPGEQRNLAGDPAFAEKLAEMKEELHTFCESIPGSFGEFKKE